MTLLPGGWRVPIVLLLATTAGCFDDSQAGAAASTPDPPAPSASVDAETGSLTGTVVDEELKPLAGVAIELVEANQKLETSPDGAFTFNALAPASYRLFAQRLGYETSARKVDVMAGEVTKVEIRLKPISINETYSLTIPRVTLIHFAPGFTYSWFVAAANNSVLNSLFCDPCWHILHFPATPANILTESEWPGGNCPAYNCELWAFYKSEWTNPHSLTDGTMAYSGNFNNREPGTWPDTSVAHLKGRDKMMLVASNGVATPIIELRVTTYTSLAYHGEFPDGFTALPPK